MSERKERPIVFSGPMVRAILEGRKTQTRRVVKADPVAMLDLVSKHARNLRVEGDTIACDWLGGVCRVPVRCPYGKPGDRLWGREAFRLDKRYDHLSPANAGGAVAFYEADHQPHRENTLTGWSPGKLRPSIFMPRWASRIIDEIVSVRVERVQDISEADAKAEGVRGYADGSYEDYLHGGSVGTAQASFYSLWSRINGPESLAANPLVWVIERKPYEPTKESEAAR